MKKIAVFKLFALGLSVLALSTTAKAQSNATDFKPSGKLWGQVIADYFYKDHADSIGRGPGQYANGGNAPSANAVNYPQGRNEFQIRRVYVGYNYDITSKFSAEVLLSAENNNPATTSGTTTGTGDDLTDGKLAPFVKLANIRWKSIYPGADLIVGQQATPTFALTSEGVWGYRSVEKTIVDIHGTGSYDLGVGLQGKFDPKTGNYGYNLLIGNGTGAKSPTATNATTLNGSFKWFYGDVWAKFLDKKLMVDLYADYNRLAWSNVDSLQQARMMVKLFVGYTTTKLTVGAEGFINTVKNQLVETNKTTGVKQIANGTAMGISVFARGPIIKNKLGFFARYDATNPCTNYDKNKTYSYTTGTSGAGKVLGCDYTYLSKEQFITAGLDFTPDKNIHIMPNIWYYGYNNQIAVSSKGNDYDLVYRVTLNYTFGK